MQYYAKYYNLALNVKFQIMILMMASSSGPIRSNGFLKITNKNTISFIINSIFVLKIWWTRSAIKKHFRYLPLTQRKKWIINQSPQKVLESILQSSLKDIQYLLIQFFSIKLIYTRHKILIFIHFQSVKWTDI